MTSNPPSSYFEGVNEKLLQAIPRDATNVLEFGCANGRLGAAFKSLHPHARWTGVDIHDGALSIARQRIDQAVKLDLNVADLSQLGGAHDCLVFGDLLEHLIDPGTFLASLHDLASEAATLICCVPNMAHASVIERMLAGDLTYDENGLLDETHMRFLSPASVFKLFLDAGWLPTVVDKYTVGLAGPYVEALIAAGLALGIPRNTTLNNILSYQLIVSCKKTTKIPIPQISPPLSVIVPVNNPAQFKINIARSPGLKEIGAQIIPVQGAKNPAHALNIGRDHAASPWLLFCHQDVYIPKGSGFMLQSIAASVPEMDRSATLFGFAGLQSIKASGPNYCGLVVDRMHLFDHRSGRDPLSIDEFAILLAKDSFHAIDEGLGWHAWATDMCIASHRKNGATKVLVERVPMFHNSYNDSVLDPAFYESIRRLFNKYSDLDKIPTLNGTFERKQVLSQPNKGQSTNYRVTFKIN